MISNATRKTRKSTALAAFAGLAVYIGSLVPAHAVGLLTPVGDQESLDLKRHNVSVVVEDGYAITTIEQTFTNPNATDREAVYSFPVPRKAAVSEFTYWIDGNPVSAEVMEKEKARKTYESEKQTGRETAIAERDEYRTFDIKVWPVRAGGDAKIRLAYIQPAHLDTGIGRYLYPLEEGGVDERKLAFWTAKQVVTEQFSFDLHLRTDYPIEALRLPDHPAAQITQDSDGTWRVHMDNQSMATAAEPLPGQASAASDSEQPVVQAAPVSLDRDIVVYWRLAENQPARVDMVPYRTADGKRGTFMLTLTPGMDLKPITEGRDWVFVLDRSGSMSGKIATLAEGVIDTLGQLNPEDRFRIVFFNNQVFELTHGFTPATAENVKSASAEIRRVPSEGGTNLYAGLSQGLNSLDADRTGSIILVTDGVANVGRTEVRDFLDLTAKTDVRMFTAVMGNSANRPLLEPMTRASGGFATSVSNADDVSGMLLQATSKVTHEALHGVRLSVDPAASGLRFADLRRDDIRTLYHGEQLVLFGHYWGEGSATVILTGEISGTPVTYETDVQFPTSATANPEIERLWAFAEIEHAMQEIDTLGTDADLKDAIIGTSTEYGILTPYTAMLVVRDERFEELAIKRTNRDRLAIEKTARDERRAKPIRSVRVDSAKPMFSNPAPSHSGSGSGNAGLVGLLIALAMLLFGRRAIAHSRS